MSTEATAKRCQYMTGASGATEPSAWCRLVLGHEGVHDLDYEYDRPDDDRYCWDSNGDLW